jgi:hypothetical protein
MDMLNKMYKPTMKTIVQEQSFDRVFVEMERAILSQIVSNIEQFLAIENIDPLKHIVNSING